MPGYLVADVDISHHIKQGAVGLPGLLVNETEIIESVGELFDVVVLDGNIFGQGNESESLVGVPLDKKIARDVLVQNGLDSIVVEFGRQGQCLFSVKESRIQAHLRKIESGQVHVPDGEQAGVLVLFEIGNQREQGLKGGIGTFDIELVLGKGKQGLVMFKIAGFRQGHALVQVDACHGVGLDVDADVAQQEQGFGFKMRVPVLPEKFQCLQSLLEGIGVQAAGGVFHGKGQVQQCFFKNGFLRQTGTFLLEFPVQKRVGFPLRVQVRDPGVEDVGLKPCVLGMEPG